MGRLRILNKLILSKVTIKPSSPTPCHLKTYNLSSTDTFMPPNYVPLVFFYPYYGSSNTITSHQEKATQLLKKSLSQTLTEFYPFSGKLVAAVDGSYVDCNDDGVEFVEARVNAHLSQVVDNPSQSLDPLFPTGSTKVHTYNNLLKVQISYFDCGGLALAVFLNHKIGDGCSALTFIKHWATVNHNHYNPEKQLQTLPPHFLSFQKSISTSEIMIESGINCVSKTFVFPNSKIEELKAEVIKAQSLMTNKPTRVEVVNSLLYRCAVRAAKANRPRLFNPYFLAQTINMRKRLANPLKETTIGNFTFGIEIPTITESQLTLNSLVSRIKMAKSKIARNTISQLNRWQKLQVGVSKCIPKCYEIFLCSSLCGYQVYRIDFGWGKPIRVTFTGPDKFFILMDTPGEDGIEALVRLEEEDMAKFQVDKQLLAVAHAA